MQPSDNRQKKVDPPEAHKSMVHTKSTRASLERFLTFWPIKSNLRIFLQ